MSSSKASSPERASWVLRFALLVLQLLILLRQVVTSNLVRAKDYVLLLLDRSLPKSLKLSKTSQNSRGKRAAFPSIVGIVLAEVQAIDIDDIANITRWCCECGLEKIQIFEQSGQICQAAAVLEKRLNFSQPPEFGIVAGFSLTTQQEPGALQRRQNGKRNHSSLVDVQLLDHTDALEPLLVSSSVKNTQVNGVECGGTSGELFVQIAEVKGARAVQEPDLVLVFGPALTLSGFPPWLLRYSEIYHAGCAADATLATIQRLLQKYCRTSQRFGT